MADYEKIYSTTAINTAGRDGKSYLEDGTMEFDIRTPEEMGGEGGGTNPEQLFALGYSACYNGALEIAMGQAGVRNKKSLVELTVNFYKVPNVPDFQIEVEIEVAIDGLEKEQVQEIAENTHNICPYSKATKGNIDIHTEAVEYDESKEK